MAKNEWKCCTHRTDHDPSTNYLLLGYVIRTWLIAPWALFPASPPTVLDAEHGEQHKSCAWTSLSRGHVFFVFADQRGRTSSLSRDMDGPWSIQRVRCWLFGDSLFLGTLPMTKRIVALDFSEPFGFDWLSFVPLWVSLLLSFSPSRDRRLGCLLSQL